MVVQTERLPHPGETLLGGEFLVAQGGKGANQAVAAARLGGTVAFVGRVGADAFGDANMDGLRRNGVDVRYVSRDEGHPSGVALILVDRGGENMIVVASGANGQVSPSGLEAVEGVFETADVLLVQLEIPLETVERAVERASECGVRVILNPAPARPLPEELLGRVSLLTPNRTELGTLADRAVYTDEDVEDAARELLFEDAEAVVVTLGERGAMAVTRTDAERIPSRKVEAVDATAAGDAFNGALAVALANGADLAEAIRFANAAGALAATKIGAQPSLPSVVEVEAFLRRTGEPAWGQRGRGAEGIPRAPAPPCPHAGSLGEE